MEENGSSKEFIHGRKATKMWKARRHGSTRARYTPLHYASNGTMDAPAHDRRRRHTLARRVAATLTRAEGDARDPPERA